MTNYICVLSRDLEGILINAQAAPENKSYEEIENIVNTWNKEYNTYEIIQDKVLYEVINCLNAKKMAKWYADEEDWKSLCNTLDDIEITVSHIKNNIYDKLEQYNGEK